MANPHTILTIPTNEAYALKAEAMIETADISPHIHVNAFSGGLHITVPLDKLDALAIALQEIFNRKWDVE